ncbi:hybrid sensor histidine kinase/response regulator [Candidatus Laterigemmans baculatus]|uniref:hybrid sensor histidine kinase/response regulator n=1 Tax=Candidatus Laterigemmans baculatus TaxID=2770505 RepID=UPI0013DCC50E|nr:ATP-binding protein [Candidatus Laterigemmans baculatus]
MDRSLDGGVLVLAPTPGDAKLSQSILDEAGFRSRICRDLQELIQAFSAGAGAILVTEEGLVSDGANRLVEMLRDQPTWSDVPIVLLCGEGAESSVGVWAMESLGNVTVLERPVRVTTLVSSLRTALKARRRQYELRDQLESLRQSQKSLREANARLNLLWETATILFGSNEPDAILPKIFEQIRPHLQLDLYFHFMRRDGEEALQLQSFAGLSDEAAKSISHIGCDQAICGTVARERRPVVASYIQHSQDPKAQLVKGWGVRAYACNPLIAGGKLLGTLSFASRTRNRFTPPEIAFLETITHYVTIVYERMEFIRALREDDRRKDEFLATLAHELRNPLAPIRSSLDLMRLAGNDPTLSAEVCEVLEAQVRQMVHLVDDLMDVSRITRGKLVLRKSRMDLAIAVRSAVDAAKGLIDDSGHQLTVELPEQPLWLEADPTRLTQVFSNLLNNAAKYTQRNGRIWLTVEQQPEVAVVTIRDNGTGIPGHMLESIFSMFTQVDHSLERGQGGLGIGLTLVKTLVEMHDGSITVHSDGEGHGSEFVVRLPLVASADEPAAAASSEPPKTSQRLQVLVVDDNEDAAKMLAMIVRALGHEVQTAHDGSQAVERAAASRPDVVLMDLGMPRMNGYEAAQKIREQEWGKEVLLVALTGWGQEEDRRRTKAAGFDHHLVKPVESAVLQQLFAELAAA